MTTRLFLLDLAVSRNFRARVVAPPDLREFEVLRGEVSPPRGIRFDHCMGSTAAGDFMATTGSTILVTKNVLDAIADLPGWKSFAVSLWVPGRSQRRRVFGLIITGRLGHFRPEKSRRLRRKPHQDWTMCKGMHFESPAAPFGIGMPQENWGHIFISARFARALRSLNLKDVILTPAEDVLFPER